MPGNGKAGEFRGPLASGQREKFAQAIAAGMTPMEAHKAAGYQGKSPKNRQQAAYKLKKVPEVHLRILALQSEAAAKTVESIAWNQAQVMDELKQNVEDARKGYPILDRTGTPTGSYRPDYAAVNRALELYGKQLGMFKETILTGNAEDRALDAMSDAEVRILQEAYDRIAELRRFAGARPVGSGTGGPPEGEAPQLPAVPEAGALSPVERDEAGAGVASGQPGGEDVERGDGDRDSRNGPLPGLVGGAPVSGSDEVVGCQLDERDDAG